MPRMFDLKQNTSTIFLKQTVYVELTMSFLDLKSALNILHLNTARLLEEKNKILECNC